MIELVTRKRLRRRRDAIYQHIISDIHSIQLHHLEELMRSIHILNLRIKSYDTIPQQEPEEIFQEKQV